MSNFDTRTEGTVTVANLVRRFIVSDEDVYEISKEIKELLSSSEHKKILLNLNEVESMASLMVGELIMLQKIFQGNSAVLRLCSLQPAVVDSLKISGICDLLEIDEDEESGLAKFST